MVASMGTLFSKDRMIVALIWTVLLGASWSLPVIEYLYTEQERARIESGHYYKPGMPPEWYVVR
ncbi:MAG TPA: hypothetical protein VEB20_15225 [Azospirillaceae bacterium]|nr:hypothetical protein [Azospirillaceae bacterium]